MNALALVVTAVAASQEASLVSPVRVGRPDAPLRLTVWAQQDYAHLAALPPIAEVFKGVFQAWAQAHPGVQLEVSVMPALELHKAKLLMAAAAGRLPDVASIDSFWMPMFREGGHAQVLNPYWPAEDRADFMPFTVEALSDPAGNVYGLWHETDCRVLFYRKDLVPEPPRTWAELLAVASRISRERGIAGYLYNAARWEGTVFDHLAMFWGQGGKLVDAGGRPIFGESPHRESMLRVLEFLRDTIRSGASPRSVLASNDYPQLTAAAAAGDVAMFLGGNWQRRELQNALSPEEFAKWDFAAIPQAEVGRSSTGTGGWVWVVFSRDEVRRRAAAEFIRFVEAPANSARISAATGHLPVRRSVYRDFEFFRTDPAFRHFGEMLKSGHARPAVPLYPVISEQLQIAIGQVVAGDQTPEQALDEAWKAVQAAAERRAPAQQRARSFDPMLAVPPALAAALVLALWTALHGRQRALRLWLAPVVLVPAVLLLYPMLDLLRLAFTDFRAHGIGYRYTLDSLRALLTDPAFRQMLVVTMVFVAVSVALQLGVGLLLAVLIDAARRRRARGTLLARAAVVSAWVIPGVLVGVLWKIMLVENRAGIVNYWLSLAGLGPLPLLSSGSLALASVILANVWRGCAFSMVLQFAGLQRIPREMHEAADLEGVSAWQRFRLVLLPQIKPVVALNLALITIYTLNTFDLILPLTGGGPARSTEVVSLYMYRSAFLDLEGGRAAAVAMVMLALNMALALAAVRLMLRRPAAREVA